MDTDKELLYSYNEGNQHSFNVLMQRYSYLIHYLSMRYYAPGLSTEDLIQEGRIGFMKAVQYYRDERNMLFSYFANKCIKRQIINAVKSATRKKHTILNQSHSLQHLTRENLEASKEKEQLRSYELSPEEYFFRELEYKMIYSSMAEKLTNLEKFVLDGRLEGKSYQEIARELGLTDKSVDNALRRIKRKALGVHMRFSV